MQFNDFLNGSVLLDELINRDNNVLSMEVIESVKQIKCLFTAELLMFFLQQINKWVCCVVGILTAET